MWKLLQWSLCLRDALEETTLHLKGEDIQPVTLGKVGSALREVDHGKSPEKDGFETEHLKAEGYFSFKAMAERFTAYLDSRNIPSAWLTPKNVLSKKKGDPKDPGNYRPIALCHNCKNCLQECFWIEYQEWCKSEESRQALDEAAP